MDGRKDTAILHASGVVAPDNPRHAFVDDLLAGEWNQDYASRLQELLTGPAFPEEYVAPLSKRRARTS